MGRGGTGKTSFVALTAKHFIETEQVPLLLVDLDPDQSLAEMVGVDLYASGVKTIADLITDTFIEKGGTTAGVAPTERIESHIWEEGLYEGDSFDLIAVGTKWVEGCYCLPDAALKGALGTIVKNYRYVLIDSPAGLEHLNRKVTTRVDDIFDIIGPSSKSFEHVRRAYRIIGEVGIDAGRFFIVGGYLFPESEEERARTTLPHEYLGKIAQDPIVQEHVLSGRSLLDIQKDAPGYRSVKAILERAGY
ncbi:co dehydrogenase accessory protein cooc (nickel insertion) [hydrocarbon metagenome]|uniref:Co dehydrogenase accessory protein cooc (Nickel insertion) n=1 Tax=hydrocarbon metagenome TaxID=938273 RepID=A0A0W8FHI7_9ZZZZ